MAEEPPRTNRLKPYRQGAGQVLDLAGQLPVPETQDSTPVRISSYWQESLRHAVQAVMELQREQADDQRSAFQALARWAAEQGKTAAPPPDMSALAQAIVERWREQTRDP